MVDTVKIEAAIKLLLEGIGEDVTREGLTETPTRIARMYEEIFAGMDEDAAGHLKKTFAVENIERKALSTPERSSGFDIESAEGGYGYNNEMVIEKDIVFYSTCEHHLMPFFGKAHVAYIPNGRVVGLSKLARTVETFARRPQLQEQLSHQIAEAIMLNLKPKGVMVMIEAEHLCMTMRGVKKPGSQTITTVIKGEFAENERLQNIFFKMIN